MDQEIDVVEVVEEIFNVEVGIINEEIVVVVLGETIIIIAAVVPVISDEVVEVVIHLINEIIIVRPSKNKKCLFDKIINEIFV
jgi:hypothetical protein